MIRLSHDLVHRLEKAITDAQQTGALPAFDIPELKVQRSNKPDFGDYGTPVAMQLARLARMSPDQIAEIIVVHFSRPDYLAEVKQIGGFVNFYLADNWLQQQVDLIIEQGDNYAQMDDFAGMRAQVECVSANPTGPITVGRTRGGVIGNTLARLMKAMGYEVELEYYFNNAGRQMWVLGESLKARYLERLGLPFEFPEDGYKGDYLYWIAASLIAVHGDSLQDADWEVFKDYMEKQVFIMIRAALRRVGIEFDVYFNENSLYKDGLVDETIKRLTEKDLLYEAMSPEADDDYEQRPDEADDDEVTATGPATWIKMRQLRDVKKDCAVIKSSGEPTYRLPDTAYHINKLERGFDILINILGADHIEEAKDVAAMVGALGYDAKKINVLLHQFVTLTEGGETRRMSTRRGEFVTLDELVDDVGADAVRFFILKHAPNTHMDFDLDLARQQSNENPVYYIQNAHVRCASIARKAQAEHNLSYEEGDVSLLIDPRELALIRKMIELPEIIELSVQMLEPHKIAFWAHEELARLFHPTYEEIRALYSDVPEDLARARLKLYKAAQIVFKRVLTLMGMSAPESM